MFPPVCLMSSPHICPVPQMAQGVLCATAFCRQSRWERGYPYCRPTGHGQCHQICCTRALTSSRFDKSTRTTFLCGSRLCLRIIGERCAEKMKNGVCLLEQSILVLEV